MTIRNNYQKETNSTSERGTASITIKIGSFLGTILTCVMIITGVMKILEKVNPKEDESPKHKIELEVTVKNGKATKERPKGNTPKDEDVIIPRKENPKADIVEQQPKPNKPAQSGEKPVKKSGSKTKPATEPAKPAESAVKSMTEEEHKKIVEEEKKKMDKAKKEVDERRKAEDPTDGSSNVKEDEKKAIDKKEKDFWKNMK